MEAFLARKITRDSGPATHGAQYQWRHQRQTIQKQHISRFSGRARQRDRQKERSAESLFGELRIGVRIPRLVMANRTRVQKFTNYQPVCARKDESDNP